jgi:hypothetical protein
MIKSSLMINFKNKKYFRSKNKNKNTLKILSKCKQNYKIKIIR